MLELKFELFIEKYKAERIKFNSTLHFIESDDDFKLFYKSSREKWEYYGVVTKDVIALFGERYGADREKAIADFKIEYLSMAIEIEEGNVSLFYEPLMVSKSLAPGDDIVDESKDYVTFMEKTVDKMEKAVLSSLDSIELKTFKTHGQFLAGMMNVVNTKVFMKELRKHIKKGLVEGVEDAEKELEVDIGWTENFNNKLTALEGQQLNGYSINGKMWYGIKGATKELQDKILQQVEESVRTKDSRDVLAGKIKEIFEGSTTSQAKRIARTETTRFINEGKIAGYKESGVPGHKAWSAVIDSHTSEACKRLHEKYFDKGIPFDEPFIDEKTGKSFQGASKSS